MVNNKLLSIVIPVYNEEQNIKPLVEEILSVMKKGSIDWEIIFVDDGSSDNTWKNIQREILTNSKIRAISFQSNFGKAAALDAGFRQAKGDLVVTMDGDLQDDPNEIPNFVKKIQDHDLVVGWKKVRYDPIGKTLPSKLANWVTRKATHSSVHDMNCGYKIY